MRYYMALNMNKLDLRLWKGKCFKNKSWVKGRKLNYSIYAIIYSGKI